MDSKKTQIVWGPGAAGILRKKDLETDLFVFGYSCKVFRDDAKALEMDQGKHLISWMGNEALKIDRYDARGHFSELLQLEASNQDYVLTHDERRIEQLCDEERYRALYHNEEEQEMYQEEELKRLKMDLGSDKDYNQVSYNYTDTPSNSTSQVEASDKLPEEEVEDPFVPSPLLDLPEDMVLPSTAKQNEIIEKTAKACAIHGAQMDIIIKTRQANNSKFNFMYSNSTLYPYYVLLLNQFKSGRYRPMYESRIENENNEDDEHYLHPNLASSMSVEPAPSIPSIAYKPNPDNAYTKLINKIKAVQLLNLEPVEVSPSATPVTTVNTPEINEPAEETYTPPPRRKRKKKNSGRSKNGLEQTSNPHEPPEHIKQIMMKVIIKAINRGRHPFKLGAKLHSLGVQCVNDFALPCTKYFKYYENLLNMEPYSQRLLSIKHKEEIDNESPKVPADSPTYSDNFQISDDEESDFSDFIEKLDEPLNDSFIPQTKCQPSLTKISTKETYKNKPAPVCFSIKKPREAEKLEHVSALPIEESSTDGEGDEEKDQSVKPTEPGKVAALTTDESVKQDKTLNVSESPKEKSRSKRPEEIINGATVLNSTSNSSRRLKSSSKSHHDKRDSAKHKKSRQKSSKTPKPSGHSSYSGHTSKESSSSRGHKKSLHKKRDERNGANSVSEIKHKNSEKSIPEDDDDVVKDSLLILEENVANNSSTVNDADEQRKQRERKIKVQQLLSALKNNLTNSGKANTHQQENQALSTNESGSGTVTPFDKNDEPPTKKAKSNEEDFRKKVKSSLQGYLAMISRSSTPDRAELPPVSPLPLPSLQTPQSLTTNAPQVIKASEVMLTNSGKLLVPEPKTAPKPIVNSPDQDDDDDVIFVSGNCKPNNKFSIAQVNRTLDQPVTIKIDVDSNSDTSCTSHHIDSLSQHVSHSSYKKKHNKKRKRKHSNNKKQNLSENSAFTSDDDSSTSSSSSDYDSNVDSSKRKRSAKKKRKTQPRKSKVSSHHHKKHRRKSNSSSDEETSYNSSSSSDESDNYVKHKKKRSDKKKHSKSHKDTRFTKSKKSVISKKHYYKKKSRRKRHSSSDI